MTDPTLKIEKIDKFRPATVNANLHTLRGLRMLDDAMSEDGYVAPMTAAADGEILDGSARLETAAIKFGDEVIVVEHDGQRPIIAVRRDVPSADTPEARRISLRANRIAQADLAWDAELLAQLKQDTPEAVAGMWDEREWRELMAGVEQEESKDAEPEFDKAEQLREKWGCQTGDLYAIGDHRLLVGDSTRREDVERVMRGEKARMVFTDPPYNVSYQDNESIESLKARNRRTDGLIVSNDSMSDDEFDAFLVQFLSELPLIDGGGFYLCAPPGRPETQFRNALSCVPGLTLRECIVWVKDVFVFGRQDYHWRHESILYGWKDGAAHYFVDDHTQDTVWQFDRPRTSKEHPTMKPVELPNKAIGNSSMLEEIVFDGFAGSGTTGIACQNLGRKARMIEISPAYAAVCLERFSTAFPGISIAKLSG